MAYTTSFANPALSERINNVRSRWTNFHQRRAIYNQTLRELGGLTDRELSDLGLSRGMIGSVAREAAGR